MNIFADKFSQKKWGVFNHYLFNDICKPESPKNLGRNITDWDSAVKLFDVEKLAYNLHKMNAGYYFITMMQGSKHMLAPNATYDTIAGTKPGRACSTRDLPMELADALAKYNIDLCLYYTGDGPHADREIGAKFGYAGDAGDGSSVDEAFCKNWSAVLEEYAVRYGNKVKAWWIDGCYREALGYNEGYLSLYRDAVKKGNPEALVTFNQGVFAYLEKYWSLEDFTAGETNSFIYATPDKYIDGALSHTLAPLGYNPHGEHWYEWCGWGCRGLKHTKEYMRDYIRNFTGHGGIVSVDIYVNIDGSFDPEQQAFLEWVGNNL